MDACLDPAPIRVLLRVIFPLGLLLFPAGGAALDVTEGWERLFEDEKELEDISAGRMRAFFIGSSMDNFNDLAGLRAC